MDYDKYLMMAMRHNWRQKRYDELMALKRLDLPQDVLNTIHFQYKWDTIEKEARAHFKWEVLRELRFKSYYSDRMYTIYKELHLPKEYEDEVDKPDEGDIFDEFLIMQDD